MVYKLDVKDRLLLYELDVDARQGYSTLAKKVGLSKDAVAYRMKLLERAGVIRNYIAIIDIARLGYITAGAFLKLHETTHEAEEGIISYLKKHPKVAWVVSSDGNWDINFMLWVKTVYEYEGFWREFLSKFRRYIARNWFYIITRLHHFRRGYLLAGTKRAPKPLKPVVIGVGEEAELDHLDLKILGILAPNARTSLIEIASKANVSPKVVAYRLKKLEREKVILGYRIGMNLEQIGMMYCKLHLYLRNLSEQRARELFEYVCSIPNIFYIDEKLGGADMELELEVESPERFREIIADLRHRFSDVLKEHEPLVYYKEHKLVYLPES
ncbi:MAG: Lrp/AsnC family transcriptional regulator [Candidatus Micrarchaeota archaeon]